MAKDSGICSRNREGDFSEGGVKRFDANDSVPLVVKTESTKKTVDFDLSVGRPNTDVISMLISNA